MITQGKEKGYVTYDDLNKALPPDQVSSEQIEDTMSMLSEMGINVVENEEAEAESSDASDPAESEPQQASGNVNEADLGRTRCVGRRHRWERGRAAGAESSAESAALRARS